MYPGHTDFAMLYCEIRKQIELISHCAVMVTQEKVKARNRPRGTFTMLNLAEHEILNAHRYKAIKKFGFF